jgi:hypothetical protein
VISFIPVSLFLCFVVDFETLFALGGSVSRRAFFLRTQHTEPQHRKPEDEFFQNQMWPFCLSSCSIHGGQRGDCLFVLFPGAYTLV